MKYLLVLIWLAIVSNFVPLQVHAHSFNVALVVPLTGPNKEEGRAVDEGFRLAAKERDSHADEHSDGHLGGLDVYIFAGDGHDNLMTALSALMGSKDIDKIAPVGSHILIENIRETIGETSAILLQPVASPFHKCKQTGATDKSAAVEAFIASFTKLYGYAPDPIAAQGYNMARRIDVAVRPMGGVDDKMAVDRALKQTEKDYEW
jgi:ABC-type branched-subunit amino acid transport system substrate-binding protein